MHEWFELDLLYPIEKQYQISYYNQLLFAEKRLDRVLIIMRNAQSQPPVKNTALSQVQKIKDMTIPLVEQTKNWTGKWSW